MRIILLTVFFLLCACGVNRYSANTKATYKITTPDGVVTEFLYDSEKEQKLIVELEKKADQITVLKIGVESGTSEAALAVMAQSNKILADILDKLAPLIAKGAMAGS